MMEMAGALLTPFFVSYFNWLTNRLNTSRARKTCCWTYLFWVWSPPFSFLWTGLIFWEFLSSHFFQSPWMVKLWWFEAYCSLGDPACMDQNGHPDSKASNPLPLWNLPFNAHQSVKVCSPCTIILLHVFHCIFPLLLYSSSRGNYLKKFFHLIALHWFRTLQVQGKAIEPGAILGWNQFMEKMVITYTSKAPGLHLWKPLPCLLGSWS